jgi:hypothetical protein
MDLCPFILAHPGVYDRDSHCPCSSLSYWQRTLANSLKNKKRNGLLKGIKMVPKVFLTHLLFVDDIMMFGVGNMHKIKMIKFIMDLFNTST